jgi:hypothetical protein
MSKPRKKYKPKGVRLDAVQWVINGFRNISETGDAVLHLKIKNHESLECLRKGEATRIDIDTIISAFNIAEALARMQIGDDYAKEIKAGQDALLAVAKRGVSRDEKFILKAAELTAIMLVAEIHDAQLEITTIGELEKAMDIVTKEIKMRRARSVIDTNAK